MKVRSRWFILSGALGGVLGFLLMEMVKVPGLDPRTLSGNLLRMSIYFAGFGLATGLALGMTEGVVQRRPGRAIYGFFMGMILGGVGGFLGGAVGQAIYSLVPRTHIVHSTSDLAIALDSSGSMRTLFFLGNDPWGERRSAAKNVIDRLAPTDRVAIVDFDNEAKVVHPLSFLGTDAARKAAKEAVDQIDDTGGTNLSAGLDAAVGELAARKSPGRPRFIIFLTDGQGEYSPESASRARREGIKVYTVGLGADVEANLLGGIAAETGGRYYPVANASELTALFERILRENGGAMAEKESGESDTNPLLLLGLRILSWAVMGLLIGLGQGVRENTREDLRACALGGFLGGALGGALFDPMVILVKAGGGLAGRALADIVVGACIGGSMRLAQEKIVKASDVELKPILAILPKKASVTFLPSPLPPQSRPEPAPQPLPFRPESRPVEPERPVVQARPSPPPQPAPERSNRPPLSSFAKIANREEAMAKARGAGYSLSEVAEHFGVTASAVKRAANQYGVR